MVVLIVTIVYLGVNVFDGELAPFTTQANFLPFKLLEALLWGVLIAACAPHNIRNASQIILNFLLILIFVPLLCVYAISGESREWLYANVVFWFGVVLLYRFISRIELGQFIAIPASGRSFFFNTAVITLLILIAGVLYSLALKNGVNFTFDLNELYEIRSAFSGEIHGYEQYLMNWIGFVITPFMLALGIIRRQLFLIALSIVLQLFLYATNGYKIYPLALVFTAVNIYAFGKLGLGLYALGLTVISWIGLAAFHLLDDLRILAVLINRLLILPALILFQHFDFFSSNPSLLFSQSFLRGVTIDPYQGWISHFMIADIYYGAPKASANPGFVGDAFMNFGYPGMLANGLLLVAFLKTLDWIGRQKDQRIVLALALMPFLSIQNGSLQASLLTGGVLLSFFLIALLQNKRGAGAG